MIDAIRKILSGKDCYKNRLDCMDADYTCIDCENEQLSKLIAEHDAELLDKVADRIKEKMCSENCGERQCVDSMDRCVWYGYVDEVIAKLKAEVNE